MKKNNSKKASQAVTHQPTISWHDVVINGPRNVAANIIPSGVSPADFVNLNDIQEGTQLSDATMQRLCEKPSLIMTGGHFLQIESSPFENKFTADALEKSGYQDLGEMGKNEQRALTAIYRRNGHHVTVMLPSPNDYDGIFSTDSDKTFQHAKRSEDGLTWIVGKVFSICPVFTHKRRQPEVEWKKKLLATSIRRDTIQMENAMEFGDTRIVFHELNNGAKDGGFVLAGIAESNEIAVGRSTIEGHREFENHLKQRLGESVKVHTIELKQPFYHFDTTGIVGTKGEFFTNPIAFTAEGWKKINEIFGDKVVIVPEHDMEMFLGNGTCFAENIYTSDKISDEAIEILASHGYNVYMTPIDSTYQSGGGHRCMTSVNPDMYIEGGYQVDLNKYPARGEVYKVTAEHETNRIFLKKRVGSEYQVIEEITNHALDFMTLSHIQR